MSEPLYGLLTAVLLPFLVAPLAPFVYRRAGERVGYFAAAVAAVSFALVSWLYVSGVEGVYSVTWVSAPAFGYDFSLSFLVDGFSLLMGLIASGIGVLIMVYARGYMHGEDGQGRFFAYLLAFMGSMLGVVFVENLVALFVFWELTSLTSYLLIGFYSSEAASVYGSRKSMLITVSGGLFMLVGFLALHSVTGTFSIESLLSTDAVVDSHLYVPILLLVVLGAATKSAQVPFHIWLPNAMEAPTPVSAFLHSATMVKAGVYLVGRLSPVLSGRHEWVVVLAGIGLLTMTVGALLAVQATDIKELLAYSTVSHLGLIVAGFGFATKLGAETGVFHILNHATFKAALFMVAGIVAHSVGTRSLDDLGGLLRRMPLTAGLAGLATLSMAGVPPFNGFYSKELLYEAALEASHGVAFGWLFPAVAVLASVFTFVYSVRFFSEVFLGDESEYVADHAFHSPSAVSLAPVAVLGGLIALISVSPGTAADAVVTSGIGSVVGHPVDFHPHLPTSLTTPFVMSLVTLALGGVVYSVHGRVRDGLRAGLSRLPRATADHYYDASLGVSSRLSSATVPRVDTGYLRTYVGYLLLGTVVAVLAGYFAGDVAFSVPTDVETTALPLAGVLLLTVVASLSVPFAGSHIEGVLMLSIVGFMVGIFYVISSAPDLAMTQIVIETITLVVFLVVLEKLPAFYVETRPTLERGRDLLLSLLVGATVFVTVLAARSGSPDKIAGTLVEQSVPEGGGHNVVNVILVDFRGFDTLGETTVVGMAALGVFTLIAMRRRAGGEEK